MPPSLTCRVHTRARGVGGGGDGVGDGVGRASGPGKKRRAGAGAGGAHKAVQSPLRIDLFDDEADEADESTEASRSTPSRSPSTAAISMDLSPTAQHAATRSESNPHPSRELLKIVSRLNTRDCYPVLLFGGSKQLVNRHE